MVYLIHFLIEARIYVLHTFPPLRPVKISFWLEIQWQKIILISGYRLAGVSIAPDRQCHGSLPWRSHRRCLFVVGPLMFGACSCVSLGAHASTIFIQKAYWDFAPRLAWVISFFTGKCGWSEFASWYQYSISQQLSTCMLHNYYVKLIEIPSV